MFFMVNISDSIILFSAINLEFNYWSYFLRNWHQQCPSFCCCHKLLKIWKNAKICLQFAVCLLLIAVCCLQFAVCCLLITLCLLFWTCLRHCPFKIKVCKILKSQSQRQFNHQKTTNYDLWPPPIVVRSALRS